LRIMSLHRPQVAASASQVGPAPVTPGRAGSLLLVENLRKQFLRNNGSGTEDLVVLDDVSFSVADGEFVTIVGPSGCGKTTLLSIIAGMERSDGGAVSIAGRRVSSPATDTVIIFQEDALFPWLTVAENVAFGLRNRGIRKEERERIASEYVEMVQLGQFASSYMHQLSGGMKQRVAIARGLAMDPRILLMDEPFGALDYRTREILQSQVQTIHARTKKTILFVTHDVREAVYLGDRVIILSGRPGRIKSEYAVDVPAPRHSDDPRLQKVVGQVVSDLKQEVSLLGDSNGFDAGVAI
jgi:NitT/TauT family transport system ATP-binding protein